MTTDTSGRVLRVLEDTCWGLGIPEEVLLRDAWHHSLGRLERDFSGAKPRRRSHQVFVVSQLRAAAEFSALLIIVRFLESRGAVNRSNHCPARSSLGTCWTLVHQLLRRLLGRAGPLQQTSLVLFYDLVLDEAHCFWLVL